MPSYTLSHLSIAASRTRFVLFGSSHNNAWHSRLPGAPTFSTPQQAWAWVAANLTAANGPVARGRTVTNGHSRGLARDGICAYGCEERFVSVHMDDSHMTRFEPALAVDYRPEFTTAEAARIDAAAANLPTFPSRPPAAPASPIRGIASFGVELECMVEPARLRLMHQLQSRCPRMTVQSDVSVHPSASAPGSPVEATFWSTDLAEMESWLRAMYDAVGARTNDTCGFHVHVRPSDDRQWAFATKTYWDAFAQAYHAEMVPRGRKYAERIGSRWCRMREWSLDTLANAVVRGERYNAINLNSLTRHRYGTVEHRIMPHQDSADEAVASLRWLLETAGGISSRRDFVLGEVDCRADDEDAETDARGHLAVEETTDARGHELAERVFAPTPAGPMAETYRGA